MVTFELNLKQVIALGQEMSPEQYKEALNKFEKKDYIEFFITEQGNDDTDEY